MIKIDRPDAGSQKIQVFLRYEVRGNTMGVVYQEGTLEVDIATMYRPAIEDDPKLFDDIKSACDAWFYRRTGVTAPVKAIMGGAMAVERFRNAE